MTELAHSLEFKQTLGFLLQKRNQLVASWVTEARNWVQQHSDSTDPSTPNNPARLLALMCEDTNKYLALAMRPSSDIVPLRFYTADRVTTDGKHTHTILGLYDAKKSKLFAAFDPTAQQTPKFKTLPLMETPTFGPYPSVNNVREALTAIGQAYPIVGSETPSQWKFNQFTFHSKDTLQNLEEDMIAAIRFNCQINP